MDELSNTWREKNTNGQFVREITYDVDETKSGKRVKQSYLKPGIILLLFPAQEQALITNYSKFHINDIINYTVLQFRI